MTSKKQFRLDDSIVISVTKRSSSRRIRLTIANDGEVRVSIPRWLPYSAAIEFAKSKQDWIKSKASIKPQLLENGRKVGKNHNLIFKPTAKNQITTRLSDFEAVVFHPRHLSTSDTDVQASAKRVVKRALLAQANKLLPIRLAQLADQHGFSYREVKIKALKTRWGSCDSHGNITLNLYLMELPWELIDYVLIHELNHTKIMAHGEKFWRALELKLPNYMELKKQLKSYPTLV